MRVLGVDFETTGLDPKSDRVIEVGAVIWCTKENKPMTMYSELVQVPDFEVGPEIEKITGISNEMLNEFGVSAQNAFSKLTNMAKKCEYMVAHNAGFDRSFWLSELSHLELTAPNLPWIDTLQDLPFPENMGTRKLPYLAAEHGFLNPFAHRALFDTLTMLQVMAKYPTQSILERQASPAVEVISHVSYENKDQAKNMGFRWDGQRKTWFKPMKKCDIERYEFPFRVTINEIL